MQGIGIGESDFKMLRRKDYYFIDKSLFIKRIIDDSSKVTIVTRPRRFGKTLNMSMLRYYFDCKVQDSKELFEGLKIMQQEEKYTSKQNYYPCIYMTLKDVRDRDYKTMLIDMKSAVLDIYMQHMELLDSDKIYEFEKVRINDILHKKEDEITLQNSIKELTRYLYRYYNKPVMIFLDEFDALLQSEYREGYWKDVAKFFRDFYVKTFKDNEYLEKAVLTGVTNITKDSIFSGANNFNVFTVLDNDFSADFGITREEIKKVIKDFEIEENEEDIKRWYDGYTIGNTEGIYNPWSILNYITDRKLMPYWVNTSSNDLIKLILTNSSTIKEKIERLLKDESVEVKINLETIIRGIEDNEENIWGLLLGTGYLKVVEMVDVAKKIYRVKIPNEEIRCLFEEIIDNWFSNKVIGNDLNSIMKDLVTLNLDEFRKKFSKLAIEMFSYMDVGKDTAENLLKSENLTEEQRQEITNTLEEINAKLDKIEAMNTPADYSKIDKLIAKIKGLDLENDYVATTVADLKDALSNIDRTKNSLQQAEVDAMYEELNATFNSLKPVGTAKADNTENALGATITNTPEELKKAIPFTEEEKEHMKTGVDARISLEVKVITATVTDEEKQLIKEKLGENEKVGIYLDINLFKQIGNNDQVKITETNEKITVTFEIPEELLNTADNITRTFYIVRIHDGIAEKIDAKVEDNKISFETDRFSTYALTYTDTVKAETSENTNPKTGDNIALWLGLALISIVGIVGIRKFQEKN